MMTLLPKALTLPLILTLAACSGESTRFLIEPAPAEAPVRLRVSSIEMREVVLPAYAADSQILAEGPDGGLRPVKGAEWADGSAQAVTAQLARSLDLRSTASVAAEPWPLTEPADVRLEVRIDRMVARADGRFQLSGQYALASPDRKIRDSLTRFDLSAPLADEAPGAIAAAYAQTLDQLGRRIIATLQGR